MIGRAHWLIVVAGLTLMASSAQAVNFLIDFETEDDFLTPLIHGQSVYSTPRPNHTNPFVPFSTDTHLEFGRLFNVSATNLGTDSHLGPAIFDSDPADTPTTSDPDLRVSKGNILMLQRDEGPNTNLHPTNGLRFNNPSDEGTGDDQGSIVFETLRFGVHPISIDLVDIDNGVEVDVVLTDHQARSRTYTAPSNWTTQVTDAPKGWHTLSLETLLNQPAEPNATGGDATVVQDAGFNDQDVARLEVKFFGVTPSGAIDNLRFSAVVIPEPGSLVLSGVAIAACFVSRSRRRRGATAA
jgi:hypothetical protein